MTKFELILRNEKTGKQIDLTQAPFHLQSDSWLQEQQLSFETISVNQKIFTMKNEALNEQVFVLEGTAMNLQEFIFIRDFALTNDLDCKLIFRDLEENIEYYCYVDLQSFSKKRIENTDKFIIVLTLYKTTNFIRNRIFMSGDTIGEKSAYEYLYPFKYSHEYISNDYNMLILENNGHEAAPFILEIPEGGENIEWTAYDRTGKIIGDGKLNGNFKGEIIIDSTNYTEDISFLGESVRDYRDREKDCFFKIPLGACSFNVKNVKDYTLILLEQYRVV